ncbi:hypothetical protein [Arthrobacter livingstonensis]|uniref:hypothetical protein n=1 Tax=Arthrobacter livingstonensis TaxID=670078 RepID=UPI000D7BD02C|nr:hypothetical protein [Arthrobacter livingstonensis]
MAGAVLYLMELLAIIWGGIAGVGTSTVRGAALAEVLSTYAGHADVVYAMAGWFSVILLGRILLFIGLRQVLVDSGHRPPLLDFAVAAATVSVSIETASFGIAATAAAPADAGNKPLAMLMDQAGAGLNLMIAGGLGVAIVCAVFVMWKSKLFSMPLVVLGAAAGIGITGAQLAVSPSLQPLFEVLSYFPFLFWAWILWLGVVCLRAAPGLSPVRYPDPEPEAEAAF